MQLSKSKVYILCFVTAIACSLNVQAQENRTYDGSRNNLDNLTAGAAFTRYSRLTNSVNYADGIGSINDSNLPNPRNISNNLFNQSGPIADNQGLSDFVWAFGQFICHDIDHVYENPDETDSFIVPVDDEFFVPNSEIACNRMLADEGTGIDPTNPREYINHVSSYIDASVVYGSDEVRANWLRTFEDGKLKTSSGDRLPYNTESGEYNSPIDSSVPFMKVRPGSANQKLHVAGDERANKNPLLLSLHTLFVREHNRLCTELKAKHPNWDDERLYQRARKMVGALLQKITYDEWLPTLGVNVTDYLGYQPNVEVSISNEFSAAAMLFSETMVGKEILRVDNSGNIISQGNLEIGGDFYYNPQESFVKFGIEPYLKGLAMQVQQNFDVKAVDQIRNFDFNNDLSTATDLVASVIFGGRDRGLASYNTVRRSLGLPGYSSFSNLTNESGNSQILSELYESIEDVDLWVGLLAEKKNSNEAMGDLVISIMESQFGMLRNGDRFYYENDTDVFTSYEIQQIKRKNLRDIIMDNTSISIMQENVFIAEEHVAAGPQILPIHLEANVYPNPTNTGNVVVKVHSDYVGDANFKIVNYLGQEICQFSDELRVGDNFIRMELGLNNVQRGFFNIVITSKTYINVIPLIVE